MRKITALWGRGLVGKAAIIGGGILGLFVVCCVIGAILGPQQQTAGSPTATSIPSAAAAQTTVEPSVVPATSVPSAAPEPTPYPTLTTDQLSAFQAIARHAAAMKAAGEQLIGQSEDVKAAAQALIDGQKAISGTHLPDWYSPLTERAASITGQCAAVAEAILAADAITAEQEATVQRWCITEMGRLQLQAENP